MYMGWDGMGWDGMGWESNLISLGVFLSSVSNKSDFPASFTSDILF